MAFTATNSGVGARALDVDQFRQALVGLMPDQPVTIGQQLTAQGRDLVVTPLTSPAITSYTNPNGSGGSTASYSYRLVAQNADGDALPGSTFVAAAGPAVLSPSFPLQLTFPGAIGGTQISVQRQISGVWTVIGTVLMVQGQSAAYTFSDQGSTVGAYAYSGRVPGGRVAFPAWTSYTPTFTAGGGAITLGAGGILEGRYLINGKLLALYLRIVFGTGTVIPGGAYLFTLPSGVSARSGGQQLISAFTFTSDGKTWDGIAEVAGSATTVAPFFPSSGSITSLSAAQEQNASGGTVGQSVPLVAGDYAYKVNSLIICEGILEIA